MPMPGNVQTIDAVDMLEAVNAELVEIVAAYLQTTDLLLDPAERASLAPDALRHEISERCARSLAAGQGALSVLGAADEPVCCSCGRVAETADLDGWGIAMDDSGVAIELLCAHCADAS
jgi:hypothetical protein